MDCTLSPFCGDGDVDPGEECDDGNDTDGDGCDNDCTISATCGNGTLDPGEQCDDGNTVDGDGCRADCSIPACGDGILDPGEECDDGNTSDLDVCQSDCSYALCDDCSQFELGLFFNGESCEDEVCDTTTGYTVDGIVEFSAGDSTAQFVDGGRVSAQGALFGGHGFESRTSFDEILFDVSDGDLVPLDAGTVCMIVRRGGSVPASGYRLFEARAFDNSSLVRVDFSGSDDLRLTYRDGNGMTRTIVTSWGGADSSDALLIEAGWDSTVSHHGLRLAVDGVERAVDPDSLEPLARIGELRIGNGTANAGSFAIDPVMISGLGQLDCWNALSGRCASEPLEPCIDDGDCAPGDGCVGVTQEPWQLTDACPDDPEKVEPAVCGCGIAEDDIDADREVDCVDACLDADGDGYGSPGGGGDACLGSDCADTDPTIHPGVAESPCDGIDNDCNGATTDRPDLDGDGFACEADCDDTNPDVHTGNVEQTCDGIDNDCDPSTLDDVDLDGDQFACSLDCDDTDPAVHPAAPELVCDGIDNDCDPRHAGPPGRRRQSVREPDRRARLDRVGRAGRRRGL